MPTSPPEPLGGHPGWPARLGPLTVPAGRVALRPIRLSDARAWSTIRLRDESYLAPWEPTPYGGWARRNSAVEWPGRWYLLRAAARRGSTLPFAVTVDGALAGHVMIGNVIREPLLSGYVGYWVDSRLSGRGVTTSAVAMAVDHCFRAVQLHRLEATVRPENTPSMRVLQKLGFRQEGVLERYLDVDGAWRDHHSYALTVEELPVGGLTGRLVREGRASH